MLQWSLAVSAVSFWQPENFENLENPDSENLNYLQNLGHFFLAEPGTSRAVYNLYPLFRAECTRQFTPYFHQTKRVYCRIYF